jgi:CRP-like cAMP-binding protein
MNKLLATASWQKEGQDSPLATFVKHAHPINQEVVDYINDHTWSENVSRGTYLLRTGEVSKHLYFIRKGVIRAYIKDGNKEITTWITAENDIVASIRGFNLQQPSLENLQAIEECQLVVAHYDTLQYLYHHHVEMNIVGRKILEQYYSDAEERAFISRIPNASKRYRHFLNTQGHLANRIPLKYIASYLGMTIETMSRIRSAKPKEKQEKLTG